MQYINGSLVGGVDIYGHHTLFYQTPPTSGARKKTNCHSRFQNEVMRFKVARL